LYNFKKVYLNTYNNSIVKLDFKDDIIKFKPKLMKLDFLVPILTDFRSIFKSMIDNGESNGINLVTTYSCNLNCNYCFEGQNKDKRIIKDISKYNEIWKYILPKITNPFSIAFFGGEPTLNKDSIYFFTNKIREYSKKKKTKYYLKMITNGTLIDKDFVNFFKPNEFSHIQLTFDGNKKRHNEVRGYYDKIIDSIKEIYPITSSIGVRYNITKDNWTEIPIFIKDLTKKIPLNVQKKVYLSLGFIDSKDVQISELDLEKAIKSTIKLTNNSNIRFLSKPTQKIKNCPAQQKKEAWIDFDGRKYFCERVIGQKEYEITDTSKFDNFYPKDCFSCKLYPICGGYCWVQSELKQDYYFNCLYSKAIAEEEIKKYLSKGAKK